MMMRQSPTRSRSPSRPLSAFTLIGDAGAIERASREIGWTLPAGWIVPARDDPSAAARAVALVRDGAADAVMKGNVHTDV